MLASPPPRTKDRSAGIDRPAKLSPRETRDARRALRGALADHGLETPPAGNALADYLGLLARWRARRRLAGPRTLDGLAVEAIIDTLHIDALFPASGAVLDVGSGGGMPGIPLALLEPSRRVALVEPSAARAGLLRVAVAALGLRNAEVIARRAEDVAGEIEAGGRAPADAAVARAVLPPDEWLALGCRLVRRGGAVVVLGGETWPGPADRPDLRVDVRHQYRLRGGQPRCAWRIIVE